MREGDEDQGFLKGGLDTSHQTGSQRTRKGRSNAVVANAGRGTSNASGIHRSRSGVSARSWEETQAGG